MLFRRKKPEAWWERLRIILWPRRSWDRSARYVVKRILRLTASPHAVAAGVAAGVAASFLPYVGFHFLIAFALAFVLRGNLLAAALGTFFGNPLTFPLIWASTYGAGRFFLHGSLNGEAASNGYRALDELPVSGLFSEGPGHVRDLIGSLWETTLWPMTVGAIPLSLIFGIGFYVLTRRLASWFRHARLRRLMKRQRLRAQRERRRERKAKAEGARAAAASGAAEAGAGKAIGAGGDMTIRAEAARGAGDMSGSGGDSGGGVSVEAGAAGDRTARAGGDSKGGVGARRGTGAVAAAGASKAGRA